MSFEGFLFMTKWMFHACPFSNICNKTKQALVQLA